jgi:hypothetical protein
MVILTFRRSVERFTHLTTKKVQIGDKLEKSIKPI